MEANDAAVRIYPQWRGASAPPAPLGAELAPDGVSRTGGALNTRLDYGPRGPAWAGTVTPYVGLASTGRTALMVQTFETEHTSLSLGGYEDGDGNADVEVEPRIGR